MTLLAPKNQTYKNCPASAVPAAEFVIEPLTLDRDWPEIERLLHAEDWPFVREDIEVSHSQPRAVGLVARRADSPAIAGFFLAHHFGSVGYFDMMVVDAPFRRSKLATRLGYETYQLLRANGMHGFAAHSTNDSFDVFRFFGYDRGIDFTLMRREGVNETTNGNTEMKAITLAEPDMDAVIALDAAVFGEPRPVWINTLFDQPRTQFVGLKMQDKLVASICIRPRREGALCLDAVNAHDFSHLRALLATVSTALPGQLECFARTGSDLHRWLAEQGWLVPEFFQAIGPLVEWRKGETHAFGDTPQTRSLNWF